MLHRKFWSKATPSANTQRKAVAISVESLSLFPKIPRFRSRPHDVRGQVPCRRRCRQTQLTASLGSPSLEHPRPSDAQSGQCPQQTALVERQRGLVSWVGVRVAEAWVALCNLLTQLAGETGNEYPELWVAHPASITRTLEQLRPKLSS